VATRFAWAKEPTDLSRTIIWRLQTSDDLEEGDKHQQMVWSVPQEGGE